MLLTFINQNFMRITAVFIVMVVFYSALNAQTVKPKNKFEVIYIDNSSSSRLDIFSEKLISQLRANIEELKDTNIQFILYYSDLKNYTTCSTYKDALKVINKIYIAHSLFPYDQLFDVKTIKEELVSRLAELNGDIEFNFYVSEKFVKSITEHPAYLASFLPREIATVAKNTGTVKITINYPMANNVVNTADTYAELKFMQSKYNLPLNYFLNQF
jgi:hypothetical protein